MRFPVIFATHGGGPLPILGRQPYIAKSLNDIAKSLPGVPDAIVLVSAHWETDVVSVNSCEAPELLFDYGGFPPESYSYKYPAPGDSKLAKKVSDLLSKSCINNYVDKSRKWDHGVFIPLMLMFPDADVPVVSVSVTRQQDAKSHIEVGQALMPLRDENVLIICSGASFHNFPAIFAGEGSSKRLQGKRDEDSFYKWLMESMANDNAVDMLSNWRSEKSSYGCHPDRAAEHFMPFFVAFGAGMNSTPEMRRSPVALEGAHVIWQ